MNSTGLPPTKTSQFIELWKSGDKKKAIGILHTFRMGFTQHQLDTIKMCHEMMSGSRDFYEDLGYKYEHILNATECIINVVYKKELTPK